MKLTVFGTGYVGLVSGACLADAGNTVLCVDIDAARIAQLERGELPLYEPGLADIVQRNLANGQLGFSADVAAATAFAEILFIAVGTPLRQDATVDLDAVIDVARSIGAHMDGYRLVVNKSTVPVGTAAHLAEVIAGELAARGVDHEFDVAANPEFLKEGSAVRDFIAPDRIVLGTDSPDTLRTLQALYAPFVSDPSRLLGMDARSAELSKYAANAMLATRISFINEMAGLAEKLGADIEHVRTVLGTDPRIGPDYIHPGCGYGGSCLPKDIAAMIQSGSEQGVPTDLLAAVERINVRQQGWLFEQLHKHFNGDLKGRRVALWGLAFKPETNDVREAPGIAFLDACLQAGVTVQAYDPVAAADVARRYRKQQGMTVCASAQAALVEADALVIATEWSEFSEVNWAEAKSSMAAPLVIDGRNLFTPATLREHGFVYYSVGRSA